MPVTLFKRVNLDYIYPPLRDRLLEVAARLSARGADFYATSGYRSWGAQMSLWAQGRTQPGKIVTNAKGGQSQHNFGLAVDFTLDGNPNLPGLQPVWDDILYEPLSDQLAIAGLHTGKGYHDMPHAGWGEFIDNGRLQELAKIWTDSKKPDDLTKLKEVWDYITANSTPLRPY